MAVVAGVLGLSSCDDVLDKKNMSAVTSQSTWNDKTLATAFLDYCYKQNLPDWISDVTDINAYSDDDRGGSDFFYADQLTSEGGGGPTSEYWPYSGIYALNELLDNINTGSLSESDKASIEAQALFLRAYRYFELVKRYGGVPLILSVQTRQEAEVPRAKTSECINQIVSDLKKASGALPASWNGDDAGRVTRGAALALRGRVLLYYASKQFNRNNDKSRWEDAYKANKEAIEQLQKDGYGLNATYDGTWADNTDACELSQEVVFTSRYAYPSRYHDLCAGIRPLDYSQGKTGFNCPTVELVMAYPMADGTAPGVDVDNDGVKEPFDVEATDARGLYWLNRDPRFYHTIVTNGMVYKIVDNGWPGQRQYTYKGGEVETANASKTGFYSRKFVNLNTPKVDIRKYDLDLPEIRYAEVMLNLAECAAEKGGADAEAVQVLKDIRKRAGITANADGMYGLANGLTGSALIDAIMLERRLELCYEGKRFWDLRRRMMFSDPEYQGFKRHRIEINLTEAKKNLDLAKLAAEFNENGDVNMSTTAYFDYFKTTLIEIDDKYSWQVGENHYFFALPKRHLEQNKLLEQTKGWNGGTFDPLL